jgi:hypothetical protein
MEAPVAPLSGEVALDHANLGPGLAKPQVGSNGMTFATRTQAPFADPVFVPPRPFGER